MKNLSLSHATLREPLAYCDLLSAFVALNGGHCGVLRLTVCSKLHNLGVLVAQYHFTNESGAERQVRVIVDDAQFSKFVHEMGHTGSRSANHLRQYLMVHLWELYVGTGRVLIQLGKFQ